MNFVAGSGHLGRGRSTPAQLFRVHLLALLTSAHSFNLLIELLKENRSWRHFAFLSHRQRVPDAKMLHQFRDQLGVGGLRTINQQHSCPRYFAHAPKEHEILFGSMPLSSPVVQKLITEVRAWAEACQSYEKNQLGLK
jgi:hypothetical protein